MINFAYFALKSTNPTRRQKLENGEIAIEAFELKKARDIVIVQLVSSTPSDNAWIESSKMIIQKFAEANRKGVKVSILAFTGGGIPPEEVRKPVYELLKTCRMAVICPGSGLASVLVPRAVKLMVLLTGVPARDFFGRQASQAIEYLGASNPEDREYLIGKLLEFQRKHSKYKNQVLTEFTQGLPGYYKPAVNGLCLRSSQTVPYGLVPNQVGQIRPSPGLKIGEIARKSASLLRNSVERVFFL